MSASIFDDFIHVIVRFLLISSDRSVLRSLTFFFFFLLVLASVLLFSSWHFAPFVVTSSLLSCFLAFGSFCSHSFLTTSLISLYSFFVFYQCSSVIPGFFLKMLGICSRSYHGSCFAVFSQFNLIWNLHMNSSQSVPQPVSWHAFAIISEIFYLLMPIIYSFNSVYSIWWCPLSIIGKMLIVGRLC